MIERDKRRQKRLNNTKVTKISLYEDSNNFHIGLPIKESWELLSKISKEAWFLQTGEKAPLHLDKSKIKIINKDKTCS